MTAFHTIFLETQEALAEHLTRLQPPAEFALDLETANWWKPQEERIALLQLAYRDPAHDIEVLLLDVPALQNLSLLQPLLEDPQISVAIHNASFDAVKLAFHFGIRPRPIHDTMRAARRAGARQYSLAAQVKEHFGVDLDKAQQQSDWSRRPFTATQLDYAAKDAVYTLVLYERQRELGLKGAYELPHQGALPLVAAPPAVVPQTASNESSIASLPHSSLEALLGLAALGLVIKKPHYYSPNSLVALGKERSGLAGWIVSAILGGERDLEETDIQSAIGKLMAQEFIVLDDFLRCEASQPGKDLWENSKPAQLS